MEQGLLGHDTNRDLVLGLGGRGTATVADRDRDGLRTCHRPAKTGYCCALSTVWCWRPGVGDGCGSRWRSDCGRKSVGSVNSARHRPGDTDTGQWLADGDKVRAGDRRAAVTNRDGDHLGAADSPAKDGSVAHTIRRADQIVLTGLPGVGDGCSSPYGKSCSRESVSDAGNTRL